MSETLGCGHLDKNRACGDCLDEAEAEVLRLELQLSEVKRLFAEWGRMELSDQQFASRVSVVFVDKPKSDLVAMMKTHPYTCGNCRIEIRTDICHLCAEFLKKRNHEGPPTPTDGSHRAGFRMGFPDDDKRKDEGKH